MKLKEIIFRDYLVKVHGNELERIAPKESAELAKAWARWLCEMDKKFALNLTTEQGFLALRLIVEDHINGGKDMAKNFGFDS